MIAAINAATSFWYGLFRVIPDPISQAGVAAVIGFFLVGALLKAVAPGISWVVATAGPIAVRVVTGVLLYPDWVVSRRIARAGREIPAEIRTYGSAIENFEWWFKAALGVLADAIRTLGNKSWWTAAIVVIALMLLAIAQG